MAASLLQVPVKHLQHFVALYSWSQTQPKELLHLRDREWCLGHTRAEGHWTMGQGQRSQN